MFDIDKIINFETMGGWPIEKMNLRDILKGIGATLNENTGKWEIPNDENLDVFPIVLVDDGMGYGVDEQYIVQFSLDKNRKSCSVFREHKLDYIDTWLETKRVPGDIVILDGRKWMLNKIVMSDGKLMFNAIEFLHDDDEEKCQLGESRLLTLDEVKIK